MNLASWSTSTINQGANIVVTWQAPPDDDGTAGDREPRNPVPVGPPPARVHREICN